jgi:hypothetical protein
VLSCTDVLCFDESGKQWKWRPVRDRLARAGFSVDGTGRVPYEGLWYENYVTCATVMMRRDVLARTKGMAAHRKMGEDYGLWLRLGVLGPFGHLEKVLIERRVHGKSLMQASMHDGTIYREEQKVYEEVLEDLPELRERPFVRAAFARLEFEIGYHHLTRREWREARGALVRSLRREPRDKRAWINLARAMAHVRPRE